LIEAPHKARRALIELTTRNVLLEHDVFYPPVPACHLLQQYADLIYFNDPGEEGFCLCEKGFYFAYINVAAPAARSNYTYAHELGHILMGHLEFDLPSLSACQIAALRREADGFAACLLMPEDWIRASVSCYPGVDLDVVRDLVRVYDVSYEAMQIRLSEFGLCDRDYIDYLWKTKRR
jgi:Zn-dependent peptidase ImmA (M78 family)